MKFQYIVVYENSLEKFDIGHCQIKVKVTVDLQNFIPIPDHKLSGPLTELWYKV